MDTELLRTFLEVRKTRHFARAAENLFITQAAVSARIRQLESLVGQRLLTRERNNIQLTTAGHLLVPHAESILVTLNRALLEAAGEDRQPLILLGCLPSLREIYLDEGLLTLLEVHADWRLQLESQCLGNAAAVIINLPLRPGSWTGLIPGIRRLHSLIVQDPRLGPDVRDLGRRLLGRGSRSSLLLISSIGRLSRVIVRCGRLRANMVRDLGPRLLGWLPG